MAERTDDPKAVLLSLKLVEAIALEDQERLNAVLEEARHFGLFVVMMSVASLATELLRALPRWEETLREWMIASEVESIRDTPESSP